MTLDTTDGFSLGVDIGSSGGSGIFDVISFGSFVVSTVDRRPAGSPRSPRPVERSPAHPATSTSSCARWQPVRAPVSSPPRPARQRQRKGTLKSVAQEPYAQILDSTSQQAITSFGDYAEAGTTITDEPHISESDYLQLTYSIELSNFTRAGSGNLPPPAQSNSVDSSVTIPDGYTIVVGGLSVKNLRESMNSIPLIRHVPVLNWFFSSRTKNTTDTTLFVFIRPLILRDDNSGPKDCRKAAPRPACHRRFRRASRSRFGSAS